MPTLEITGATVIRSEHGMDKVCLETSIPEPCWPYKGFCTVMAFAPKDGGVDFVRNVFGIEPTVVGIP